MKKVVALLMAAVMTVGMATVAFAAPSPAATTGTVKEAVDAKGKEVKPVTKASTTKHTAKATNHSHSTDSGRKTIDR